MIIYAEAIRRGYCSFTASALIFSIICLCSFFSASCKTPATLLTIGTHFQRTLSASEQHQYQLNFDSAHPVRVIINPLKGQVQGQVFDEHGGLITEIIGNEIAYPAYATLPQKKGHYRILVSSSVVMNWEIKYEIKVEASPVSNEQIPKQLKAEAAFLRAEKNKSEGKKEKSHLAIEEYDHSQQAFEEVSDLSSAAEVIRKKGEVQYALGESSLAQKTFEEALDNCKGADSIEVKASTLSNLVSLCAFIGKSVEAKNYSEQLWQISQHVNSPKIIAQAKAAKGEIESRTNLQNANQLLIESLDYWEKSGDMRRQARLLTQLGRSYSYFGDSIKAIEVYTKALQLSQQFKLFNEELIILNVLGLTYSTLGENQKAINFLELAKALAEQIGNKQFKGGILSGTAFIYEELGKKEAALPLRQEVVSIYHSINAVSQENTAKMLVGELYFSLGNYAAAESRFRDLLNSARTLKDIRFQAHLYSNIGRIYASAGKNNEAMQHYRQALDLNAEIQDKRWKANVLSDIGNVYQKTHRFPQAVASYQSALALNQKVGDKFGESRTRYLLAKLEQEQEHYAEALTQIKEAIKIIESLREKVISSEHRTSYFSSVNQIFEAHIEILMQQQAQDPQGKWLQDALTISERSRARTLLDSLNESHHDIKQGVDPHLLEQERLIRQSLNGKADYKQKLANQQGKETEVATVTKEVDNLTTQLDDIRSRIRETSPRYAALTQPQPLKADEIQQLLDDDTMLLEYFLGDEHSYLWAVSRHSIEAFTLPKRSTIEPMVHRLLELMTAPANQTEESAAQWQARLSQAEQEYFPRAADLSQILLGPVAAKLGKQRLIIVGDGVLQRLPFAVLPKPNDQGGTRNNEPNGIHRSSFLAHPLVFDHEITYQPSASSLKLLREDQARPVPPAGWLARWSQSLRTWWNGNKDATSPYSVAVLADPVFGLEDKRVKFKEVAAAPTNQPRLRDVDLTNENVYFPRLAATREEAAAIQKAAGTKAVLVKQGFEVNRGLLESEALQSYSILHLATHGYWDSTNPELSAIVLSRVDAQGKQLEDGMLRLSDIYNLNLRKELVVLSACETAVGKDIRGEGLVALTRGFMYAGAVRVMASLWKVEDSATAAIMKEFYQHLLQEGLSPAAALRQAQITMWKKHPTEVPYKWAAFVLQGEYR